MTSVHEEFNFLVKVKVPGSNIRSAIYTVLLQDGDAYDGFSTALNQDPCVAAAIVYGWSACNGLYLKRHGYKKEYRENLCDAEMQMAVRTAREAICRELPIILQQLEW